MRDESLDSLRKKFLDFGIELGKLNEGRLSVGDPKTTGFWSLNNNVGVRTISFPDNTMWSVCEVYVRDSAGGINTEAIHTYDYNVVPYLR